MTNLDRKFRRALCSSGVWTSRWLLALALVVAWAGGAAAQDRERAPDRKPAAGAAERQTRGETAAKLFVQGRYDEALAIYLDLYVQSGGRPEYLRNIGRCQQKLKQYDRAIESLKDYLRRARSIAAAERAEVQGFISEMESAKSAEGGTPSTVTTTPATAPAPAPAPVPAPAQPATAATAPPAPPPSTPAAPPSSPPAAPPTAAGAPFPPAAASSSTPVALDPENPTGTAPVLISQTPAPAPAPTPESSPWSGLKTGGVVALIGAGLLAAGGTAMLLSSRSTYDKAKTAGCPATGGLMCEQKAKSVTTSNQISQVLYIGAGVAGAAGITMLILAPGPGTTETRVSLGARFAF